MWVLTKSLNFQNVYLGVFADYAKATTYMRKDFKDRRSKNLGDLHYTINSIDKESSNTVDESFGYFEHWYWSSKKGKLVKIEKNVMHNFTVVEKGTTSTKESLIDDVVKQCAGEVTGGGTNFTYYDHSVLIPLYHKDKFKILAKEAKLRIKYYGKTNPYNY